MMNREILIAVTDEMDRLWEDRNRKREISPEKINELTDMIQFAENFWREKVENR